METVNPTSNLTGKHDSHKKNSMSRTSPTKSFSTRRESRVINFDSEEETELLNFPDSIKLDERKKASQNKSYGGLGLSTPATRQSFLERRDSQIISSSEDETEKLSYDSWTKSLGNAITEKDEQNLNASTKLNLSVKSDDFHIEGGHEIANSTTVDSGKFNQFI